MGSPSRAAPTLRATPLTVGYVPRRVMRRNASSSEPLTCSMVAGSHSPRVPSNATAMRCARSPFASCTT